jgi:tetratricopeptide (TPR) repeat protein
MEQRRWAEAEAAFDEVVRARPYIAEGRLARAEFNSTRGQYAKAAADFAVALERDPENAQLHYRVAIAELTAGDPARYCAACALMLERFGMSKESFVANRVAYACIYGPDAVVDMPSLIRVAEKAVPSHPGGERILAAVFFRAGRYEEALKCFDQSHKTFTPRAWDWLFLAMIHGRLRHPADARLMLARAGQWMAAADAAKQSNTGDNQSGWNNEYEKPAILRLRSEAEALVRFNPVFPLDPFAR